LWSELPLDLRRNWQFLARKLLERYYAPTICMVKSFGSMEVNMASSGTGQLSWRYNTIHSFKLRPIPATQVEATSSCANTSDEGASNNASAQGRSPTISDTGSWTALLKDMVLIPPEKKTAAAVLLWSAGTARTPVAVPHLILLSSLMKRSHDMSCKGIDRRDSTKPMDRTEANRTGNLWNSPLLAMDRSVELYSNALISTAA
jgi:hypothetical protein